VPVVVLLAAVCALLWTGLAHRVLSDPLAAAWAPALLSLPVALALGLPGGPWRWPRRSAALLLFGAAWMLPGAPQQRAEWIGAMQHLTAYGALALWFGSSLRPGAMPIAARVAAAVLPGLPPAVQRYCRWVTAGWTLFFVLVAALALALFLSGGAERWRLFALWLSPALVVAMFVLEFVLRRWFVPAGYRASIGQTVRGFRALFGTVPAEAPTR